LPVEGAPGRKSQRADTRWWRRSKKGVEKVRERPESSRLLRKRRERPEARATERGIRKGFERGRPTIRGAQQLYHNLLGRPSEESGRISSEVDQRFGARSSFINAPFALRVFLFQEKAGA
jgi:hypothetical protein